LVVTNEFIIVLGGLLIAATVQAEEVLPVQEPMRVLPVETQSAASPVKRTLAEGLWKAQAEAGIVMTNGNSETQNIRLQFKVEHEQERWRERLSADYLKVSEKSQTSAERFATEAKADYEFGEKDYYFLIARYETNRFAGYDAQISESAGYGRRFRFGERALLETEAGVGSRYTSYVDGVRKNEGILRIAAKFSHTIGSGSEFREEAFTEIGHTNTHTESVTSLKSRVNGNLSMKLAFTAIHNSSVPLDTKQTDTITSATLVYDF
jgi:putative salt-induced outer membrane protein